VNVAVVLAQSGARVGLLDADIYGPNIPTMMGVQTQVKHRDNMMIPEEAHGVKLMSIGFLVKPGQPIVWRGPMLHTAIQQFLSQVEWGELDYLVVDLPPGTGDEALTIAQLAPNLRGAVIVTTPQDVAVLDAVKAIKFIEKLEIPVIGIIENMSGMCCPHCGETVDLFGRGGGERAAHDLGVPYLGAIPLDPAMVKACDEGRPYILRHADSPTWRAVDTVMENLVKVVES
jgi:ATP-binding protein involved in chromosome partitioning